MEELIPVINKLQDIFNTVGSDEIQLPQIVVVGTQSSGKSSVIESLVGRSFLPRGPGIVTRCPLVLQLIYCPKEDREKRSFENGTQNLGEWAIFHHSKERIYTDFEDIRSEIEDRTNKMAGFNKDICSEPILLKIYSTSVLNLTLVDLPGLTQLPVGDQPEDIRDQIWNIVFKYVSNPNSIILAIVPANTDIATSESLKFAKAMDSDGRRTLAVLTKLDLMDAGTDASEILCGRVIPVKLGIIGVINRSQKDINDKQSIEDALHDEAVFFKKNYPNLACKNGTPYLVKVLNSLLMNHIRVCLPDLKTRVNAKLLQFQSLLSSYGDDIADKSQTLLQIITKFASAYRSTIEGTTENIEITELCGGARICYIFHDIFGRTIDLIHPLAGLTKTDILTAMRNAMGLSPALYIPEASFELLVKRQIRHLEKPSLCCIKLVYEELKRIIQHCSTEYQQEMLRFPKLHLRIVDVVTELIRKQLPMVNSMVKNLVAIELAYINTNHPVFVKEAAVISTQLIKHREDVIRSSQSWSNKRPVSYPSLIPNSLNEEGISSQCCKQTQQRQKSTTSISTQDSKNTSSDNLPSYIPTHQTPEKPLNVLPNLTGQTDCDVIERLIESYFYTVRNSIKDSVPKAVMHFLVNHVKDNIETELLTQLYKSNSTSDNAKVLLTESKESVQQRKDASDMLKVLQKANHIIDEIHIM